MASGACNCRGVTYEVTREITDVYICHCSICRKATGANGIAVVVVSNDEFSWTNGEDLISQWRKPLHDWQIWFCRACGSPVPGQNDKNTMFIPVGSLEEGYEALEIKHHIWVDSKAAWDVIGDSGQQHPESIQS